MLYLIETIGPSGMSLYFVIFNQLGQVWNTTLNAGDGGWETYDSGHWAQYAIAMTEKDGSGYYSGEFPSEIDGFLTTEVIYNNGAPTLGDAPYGLGQSQGVNIAAIDGDATTPPKLQASVSSMVRAQVAAGMLTTTAFTTGIVNAEADAYQGRSVLFATGTLAGQGGVISTFDPGTGLLTVTAPFTQAPDLDDVFVIS